MWHSGKHTSLLYIQTALLWYKRCMLHSIFTFHTAKTIFKYILYKYWYVLLSTDFIDFKVISGDYVFLNYAGIKFIYIQNWPCLSILKHKYLKINTCPEIKYNFFTKFSAQYRLTVICKYFKLLTLYSTSLTYYFNCTMESKYLQ